MPCHIKPDMHHTWLCIMPWLCRGCLLCCLLLSGVLLRVGSDNIEFVRIRSSTFRLSSSWTRSSSLRDFRQDDHTLEITIFAMLVCSLFCYANATMPTFFLSASQFPCQTSNPPCPSKPLIGYVTALLSPSYSVASCRWRLEAIPCWNIYLLVGISLYCHVILMHLYTW